MSVGFEQFADQPAAGIGRFRAGIAKGDHRAAGDELLRRLAVFLMGHGLSRAHGSFFGSPGNGPTDCETSFPYSEWIVKRLMPGTNGRSRRLALPLEIASTSDSVFFPA